MQIQNEKIFFQVVINDPDYIENCDESFFDNKIISRLFKIVRIYWRHYKAIPTREQIWEVVKHKELEEEIPEAQIEIIWDVDLEKYEDDWKKENAEYFIQFKTLEKSGFEFANYLKTTPTNPSNIKEVVERAKGIIVDQNNINFGFKEGSDFYDPEAHVQRTYHTFSTGYPNLDVVSGGGFRAKTLTIMVGQAKIGKSLWLGNLAAKAIQMGHNVAVVTLEMDESLYIARIGANTLSIPIRDYKEVSQNTEKVKEYITKFRQNNFGNMGAGEPGKLHVKEFPTSTAGTIEIESYLRKYEEKNDIKFKVVIVDYINIMKNWRNPNSENTYMKIKQIAEDLRGVAGANEWAVISATQIKQKDFDSTDMSMSAVAESSGLVATVDLMFGIIQDPTMLLDKKYKLKVLANRQEGWKNAHIPYLVDYTYMRITEDGDIVDNGCL